MTKYLTIQKSKYMRSTLQECIKVSKGAGNDTCSAEYARALNETYKKGKKSERIRPPKGKVKIRSTELYRERRQTESSTPTIDDMQPPRNRAGMYADHLVDSYLQSAFISGFLLILCLVSNIRNIREKIKAVCINFPIRTHNKLNHNITRSLKQYKKNLINKNWIQLFR